MRSSSAAQRLETAIRARLGKHRAAGPLVVGICGSQGSGKSTACELVARVDKARDDREPESRWSVVDAPVDLILFEGWCVGAQPQAPGDLATPANALEAEEDADGRWRRYVNDALSGGYQRLFARIDFLALLAAPSFEVVLHWRTEQERQLRAARPDAPGVMPDVAIRRFVQHYERLTRHILDEMPALADLLLRLDENRRVL